MNEIYFKWNDCHYKRTVIDNQVCWHNLNANGRLRGLKRVSMEIIYKIARWYYA